MKSYLASYDERPIEFTRGKGCFLYDTNGRTYLDFLAGWCVGNIGYGRSEIMAATKKQAKAGCYIPPFFHHQTWEQFAKLLCTNAPGDLTRAFRVTSGSEAVEMAIKCARAATGKPVIISIDEVYHGHTYAAATVGEACTVSMSPCLPGFEKIPLPRTKDEADKVVEQFQKMASTRKDIAAFLSEPVWTNVGVYVPEPNFYPRIEKICRQYGILFIMDEVATGFGRCGKLFASELWNLTPDIICLGKGLTGGYATLGATLVTEEIYKLSNTFPSYSTFGWNLFDLAAAQKNVEIIIKEKLSKQAQSVGAYLFKKLKTLEVLPKVKEVRGIGMIFGIELKNSDVDVIAAQCLKEGLIIETARGKTLFISPPLVLTKKLADKGVKILAKIIS